MIIDNKDDEQSEEDSSTPESDGDDEDEVEGDNDNTVVLVEGPLEEEGLQMPVSSSEDKAGAEDASSKPIKSSD